MRGLLVITFMALLRYKIEATISSPFSDIFSESFGSGDSSLNSLEYPTEVEVNDLDSIVTSQSGFFDSREETNSSGFDENAAFQTIEETAESDILERWLKEDQQLKASKLKNETVTPSTSFPLNKTLEDIETATSPTIIETTQKTIQIFSSSSKVILDELEDETFSMKSGIVYSQQNAKICFKVEGSIKLYYGGESIKVPSKGDVSRRICDVNEKLVTFLWASSDFNDTSKVEITMRFATDCSEETCWLEEVSAKVSNDSARFGYLLNLKTGYNDFKEPKVLKSGDFELEIVKLQINVAQGLFNEREEALIVEGNFVQFDRNELLGIFFGLITVTFVTSYVIFVLLGKWRWWRKKFVPSTIVAEGRA